MAVRHTDEGLELRLIDYLLMAREATSVEITEEAKGLEPLDKTFHMGSMRSMRVLKLEGLCLKLGTSFRIEVAPSGDLTPDALAMRIKVHVGGRGFSGAPVPLPVDLFLGRMVHGEMQWVPSKLTIWHNEMPRPTTPQEYMAIIWSRLGRKELATHLLLQIEEWVEYLGGAI